MVATGLLLASVLALGYAMPAPPKFVVHESRDGVPKGFVRNSVAPSSTALKLRIALVSNDMAGLEKAVYDVSTPSSSNYGNYLSKEEVEAFVAPSPGTTTAVNEWLASHGVTTSPISPAGDMLSFSVDVQKANELLGAEFSVFTHQDTGEQSIRTLSYSVPASLHELVEFIHPTIVFPDTSGRLPIVSVPFSPPKNFSSDAPGPSCASFITPSCLRTLYGIPATPATQPSNKLAVAGFINQFAQQADLTAFLQGFRPDINPATTFATQTIDGGSNPQGPSQAGGEANLDIQYTVGVATGVPVTFISVGQQNVDGISGWIDITNFLLSQASPPYVLSTSYGFNEPDLSSSIATTMCNAYMQLAARGVSALFASGDGGVGGFQPTDCTNFVPSFPSGCPFVTSVGGTTGISPETSASFSSGGFSNFFSTASYQSAAVSGYLSRLGNTNAGRFNSGGRGFPDISAQAENVLVFNAAQEVTTGGTSASTPIFASVVSLLNDLLIANGRPVLGFLNPFLYSTGAAASTDITSGNNPGCGTDGFPVTSGWDPVTGLGTPNFASLRAVLGL